MAVIATRSILNRQMLANVSGTLNSKRLYQSSGKEKENRLVFTSSTKREIRHLHAVVVQRRQRNLQKRVMQVHKQSCCFANLKLLLFLPFSLPSPSSLLKFPNDES